MAERSHLCHNNIHKYSSSVFKVLYCDCYECSPSSTTVMALPHLHQSLLIFPPNHAAFGSVQHYKHVWHVCRFLGVPPGRGSCPLTGPLPFDLIYTDYHGLQQMKQHMGLSLRKHKSVICSLSLSLVSLSLCLCVHLVKNCHFSFFTKCQVW